ncbi:MAG: hypothetical protein JOZ14_04055 [Acidobacteria bacterium]|nr:hypothetical protein [Acidobacteriota bacterium]
MRTKNPAATAAKIAAVVGLLALLYFARFAWDYFDPRSPANLSINDQLKFFGAAMYEYESTTGHWPQNVNDLAETSLPRRSHVWRQTAGAIVFLWPQDLKPESKENANVLLAYWNAGLFSKLGRIWVCWGDLHTERLKHSELRARLAVRRKQ